MTLRCECGGAVTVQDGTDPKNAENGFWERYECASCGRTGTLTVDGTTNETRLTGCLTDGDSRGFAEVNRGP